MSLVWTGWIFASWRRSPRRSPAVPVGLTTLASAVGEDPGTLEDVYEPYLLQCGLMIRTPQGRQATLRTFEHLGIEPAV